MATEKRLIDLLSVDFDEMDISDCTDIEDIISAVITHLSEQPEVDAVEVVRCKDCKHWNVHPINGKLSLGKCVKFSRGMADTWFCSFGERREDG